MRIGQRLALVLVSFTLPALAAVNGCVSDDSAAPSGDDAATPYDGAPVVTTGDAGFDATPAVDGTVNDANPTSDANPITDAPPIEDTNPPIDAFDAGPMAQLRVAWFDDPSYTQPLPQIRTPFAVTPLVPAAPRFDACIALHGTNVWKGPLLATAGSAGLALNDVSRYFDVPPGQYDVRVVYVPAGTTATCALDDGGSLQTTDFTDLPVLAANARLTAVATPVYSSKAPGSVAITALVDDTTVTAGKVKLRFANVSSQVALDYGLGGGDVYTPLFTNVAFPIAQADADAGTNVGVDTNGYVEIDPFAQIDTTMGSAGLDQAVTPPTTAPAGTILSAFAVTAMGGGEPISALLLCDDVHPNLASPLLSNCSQATYLDPAAPVHDVVRFANFIDGQAGGIDFCIKYHAMPSYPPHSIGSVQSLGTAYGLASERYNLHGGFTFDVRVVAGGATDCTQAQTPDVSLTTPSTPNALTTMAFTGTVVDGGAVAIDAGPDAGGVTTTAFAALTFGDSRCLATEMAPVVRVINLADEAVGPQTAALNGGDTWSFTNVPYGAIGAPNGVDSCGYLGVTPETNGVLTTTGDDLLYTNTAQTETLYLYSTGATTSVLACDDNDPSETACVHPQGNL